MPLIATSAMQNCARNEYRVLVGRFNYVLLPSDWETGIFGWNTKTGFAVRFNSGSKQPVLWQCWFMGIGAAHKAEQGFAEGGD